MNRPENLVAPFTRAHYAEMKAVRFQLDLAKRLHILVPGLFDQSQLRKASPGEH